MPPQKGRMSPADSRRFEDVYRPEPAFHSPRVLSPETKGKFPLNLTDNPSSRFGYDRGASFPRCLAPSEEPLDRIARRFQEYRAQTFRDRAKIRRIPHDACETASGGAGCDREVEDGTLSPQRPYPTRACARGTFPAPGSHEPRRALLTDRSPGTESTHPDPPAPTFDPRLLRGVRGARSSSPHTPSQ